ncbi:MAG TPA: cysteine desulfurase NifS [Deltaproteobacteria bacterium]|nr:cysteine desulfurase NifS [Deltaproteobacteria bacterium]
MPRIYLDNNATTPVHPQVADAIRPFLNGLFGNPSSLHFAGREVKTSYEAARGQIARTIGAGVEEVVITSCGSEADNHAIKGIALAAGKGHIITSMVEHPAVLNVCRYLETRGFTVTYLPVDGHGLVDPDDVRRSIKKDTILISIMYANNETGTVMPVGDIARIAREKEIPFHSDMVQALGKLDVDVRTLGVDLASFSGHKVYAPKGVGALYVREGIGLHNLIHGGHQESGRRAGTENVIGIVAFGKACEIAGDRMDERSIATEALRKRLLDGILERIDHVRLNGHPVQRVSNTLNLSFQFVESESLLLALDMKGVAVSSGSACSSGSSEPSHVLLAMGIPGDLCQSALRFSLGRDNTREEIDYVIEILPGIVARLREMSPFYKR